MNISLREWIADHEGFRSKVYEDTVGKKTLGFGRNVSDLGVTLEEAYYLLGNDINRCVKELEHYHWYNRSPCGVQEALVNMCFNLGLPRLIKFKNMIKALEGGNYNLAALEALDSVWAKQVGDRAKDIASVIRDGR